MDTKKLETLKSLLSRQYGLGWFGPKGEIAGLVEADMGWDHCEVLLTELIEEAHEKADSIARSQLDEVRAGTKTALEAWKEFSKLQRNLNDLISTCVEIIEMPDPAQKKE